MKKLLTLAALALTPLMPAQALRPNANALFVALIKDTGMKQIKCPGARRTDTACATSSMNNDRLQAQIGSWNRWKQKDPWLENQASFTSHGNDRYTVAVSRRIDGSGSLLVLTEFKRRFW